MDSVKLICIQLNIACVVWFKWLAMRKVYLSSSLEHNEKEPRRAECRTPMGVRSRVRPTVRNSGTGWLRQHPLLKRDTHSSFLPAARRVWS